VLSCLVEFNSIEQALALQDEIDREDMQLLGKGKKFKVPEGQTPGLSSDTIEIPDLSSTSFNWDFKTNGAMRGHSL
jgi:hypothetical protein